jgi:hypothetical protein
VTPHKHTGGRPPKYVYPETVGAEARNPAPDRRVAKLIMSCASQRAAHFGFVYRCRCDGPMVVIRRVA